MRLWRPSFDRVLAGAFVVMALAWGAFLGARQLAGVESALDRLEDLTLDWRFSLAGVRPVPRGVVIAALDDETLRQAGGYPLPRKILARIVRGIAAHNPQAIALDVLFLDPGKDDGDDQELADALQGVRSVVGAMAVFDHDASPAATRERLRTYELALVPRPSDILWPIPAIRRAARTGLVNLATDQAGVPRYVPMIFRRGDAVVPSFALAAAAAALNTEPVFGADTLKLAGRSVSMDLGYHLPIRHYGPRGTIRQFSAARALGGNLDPNEVRGQVVIIGATAVALGDTFATPFDRIVPGVEIFATAISNLLAGDGLVKTDLIRRIDAGAAVVLAALTVVFMGFRRTWIGLGLAVALFALWGAMTFGAFLAGYWLSVAVPVAAVMPVAVAYGFSRIGFDRYVATRLAGERAALTRFQSPLLIDHIVRNPSFLEKPVRQEVAVVFLDLSGFTGVAEALGPEWTRDLLADFQAVVERAVLPHGGFVVSFMGDGAMIVFGLPEPRPDDAARAVVAVMGLHRAILGWLAALPPIARERLSVRIGGHCGPVVVSRLGPVHHQHVTATGDTVNATSRLLEVAKQQRCSVVITEHLFAAASLAESSDDAQAIGPPLDVDIRGRAQPLRIRVVK